MRIVRHISFSNVIAVIALFIALGGAAYAGSKINGKNIVNKSIGGGKLKNETITANKIKKGTITSAQIAPGSIDSTQININTLTTVPSAQTANTATTATTATTAKSAETATKATSAITADEADEAKEADSAKHAKEADNALHANEADVATTAGTATNATHADDADTIEGETGEDLHNELKVGCTSTTEFYGGMCWDKTNRPAKLWLVAVKTCGDAGGRLPTISELIAFVLFDQTNEFAEDVWSGDLADVTGPAEEVLTSDENGREKHGGIEGPLGYRCVFPLTN
jgi:hypothetical protein